MSNDQNLLDENERLLWHQYVKERVVGETGRATLLATNFINAFESYPTARRENWIADLCRRVVDQHEPIYVNKILLEKLVVPYLLRRSFYWHGESARWLSYFIDLIYQHPPLWPDIAMAFRPTSREAKIKLLKRAVILNPNDNIAAQMLQDIIAPITSEGRKKRLQELESQFYFVLHELPLGVLIGPDGTTSEECDKLLAEVHEFSGLAAEENILDLYAKKIARWRHYFIGYRDYQLNRSQYANFAEYMGKHPEPV